MTKAKLAARLSQRTGLSLKDARAVIDALFSTVPRYGIIVDELRSGRRVQITGFGTFETRQRRAREGINPQTGEKIRISATRCPAFQAGKALKQRVRR